MKIGFTGTRSGMTAAQKSTVALIFCKFKPSEAHEGDCVGADAEFWEMASAILKPEQVVIHPPVKDDCRAFKFATGNIVREPLTYFARNRAIVEACEVLIAAPVTMAETPNGGTWQTINHARKVGKPVVICWPDGKYTKELLCKSCLNLATEVCPDCGEHLCGEDYLYHQPNDGSIRCAQQKER